MNRSRIPALLFLIALAVLSGCATRPINPPLERADVRKGYRFETRWQHRIVYDNENIIILAFSGGGTRAAAFAYGALEALRGIDLILPTGRNIRMLDEVDIVTGVSGGAFTALAFGLYGDKLFNNYEQRFLKRDVERQLLTRTLNPANWGRLMSKGWGRSELAAELYDEMLFNGATFGDLDRGTGPVIMAAATDLTTGSRFVFSQRIFDIICSDLSALTLSRAAAASSAVPVVLSPVTINNYGGTCNTVTPAWVTPFVDADPAEVPRPAARAIRQLQGEEAYADGVNRPYLHLVDGAVSDNVGMRSVLMSLEILEALQESGVPTRLDTAKRIVVFIVNSMSSPTTKWDQSESVPGLLDILSKTAGTPIDTYSYETIEVLKDTAARWRTLRMIRDSAALKDNTDPAVDAALRVPDAEIYAIDVSFSALEDKAELHFLNQLPTSLTLPAKAIDRLRAAAGTLIMASPEFQRFLREAGAKLIIGPAVGGGPAKAR